MIRSHPLGTSRAARADVAAGSGLIWRRRARRLRLFLPAVAVVAGPRGGMRAAPPGNRAAPTDLVKLVEQRDAPRRNARLRSGR